MGQIETLMFFGTILGGVVATGAAISAKRSADAASSQADSAKTQAHAALVQAEAAKEQVRLASEALKLAANAQSTADLALIGKAVMAINKHASAAGMLMLEAIGSMDPHISEKRKIDWTFYGEVKESAPDVYPVLTTPELRTQWKFMRDELQTLQGYIGVHAVPVGRKAIQDSADRHWPNAPKDMMDAFSRCAKLNYELIAFAKKFDL